MAALYQAHAAIWLGATHIPEDLPYPGTRCVHDRPRGNLSAVSGIFDCGHPMVPVPLCFDETCPGEYGGAPFGCIHGVQHNQTAVIDPAIRINEGLCFISLKSCGFT